jgi:hypothetical protein
MPAIFRQAADVGNRHSKQRVYAAEGVAKRSDAVTLCPRSSACTLLHHALLQASEQGHQQLMTISYGSPLGEG